MNHVRDTAVTVALVASFATVVTVHVATLFGLAKGKHWLDVLVSIAFSPAAPYFAWKRAMRARAIAWAVAVVGYIFALLMAK